MDEKYGGENRENKFEKIVVRQLLGYKKRYEQVGRKSNCISWRKVVRSNWKKRN